MWFFFVSVAAHFSPISQRRMQFAMTWYSFVFPNTALTTATFAVATALDGNRAFQIVGCVLSVGLVVTWCFVFGTMIRAVVLRQVLWPQMQEDRDEGGWGKDDKHRKGEVFSGWQSSHYGHLMRGQDLPFSPVVGTPIGSPGTTTPIADGFDPVMNRKATQNKERRKTGWIPRNKAAQER